MIYHAWLVLVNSSVYTKFGIHYIPSFTRSKDTIGTPQLKNGFHDPEHAPVRGELSSLAEACYGHPMCQIWSLYVHWLGRYEKWHKMSKMVSFLADCCNATFGYCHEMLSVTRMHCGQTVSWIRMPLGTEASPNDIVLDGDPAPPTQRGTALYHGGGLVICKFRVWEWVFCESSVCASGSNAMVGFLCDSWALVNVNGKQ